MRGVIDHVRALFIPHWSHVVVLFGSHCFWDREDAFCVDGLRCFQKDFEVLEDLKKEKVAVVVSGWLLILAGCALLAFGAPNFEKGRPHNGVMPRRVWICTPRGGAVRVASGSRVFFA